MFDILYTVAIDEKGKIITVTDAEKGQKYSCPVCKTELILRKSGKTGKGSKRPHFSHKIITQNCTAETALHYSFKNLLAKELELYVTTNYEFNITWNCKLCNSNHSANLLEDVKFVRTEHDLILYRPDIALLDKNEKVLVAIEIVVSNPTAENKLLFYKEENIKYIQINLQSDTDIENIEEKASFPDDVDFCLQSKCDICKSDQFRKILHVIENKCLECGLPVKAAIISIENKQGSEYIYPKDFEAEEINCAIS
ncbi:competence protein CoiA family protein [Methanimicrococcus blatticola]|uniref:Competence protein CoiA-like N-terminal domain-containing protein n=1 Tax=Methanimicrococcus blatticola TaxID=91560 RepID=A0A484F4H0_9EURY|nr:competence protein CoiA family protein [Methanimicrococcus blatticola]MBZ3935473.1 hypothetical protein [Methanimicrococcus blatticola]MCC2509116.1 hypothetical protein [Methanimicrococcus blatticola]TDQ69516.1 hypothetical protein C7391_0849 [Methanimicrococcus blatticola]